MKNNDIFKVLLFSSGLVSGVGIGIISTKTKFKKLYSEKADKEIQDVKAKFKELPKYIESRLDEIVEKTEYDPLKNTSDDEKLVNENMVNQYKSTSEVLDGNPLYISPNEFGDDPDYDLITMTYYTDDVLADDSDYRVDNIGETVGDEFVEHFGEYDDDAVYVRNDLTKCYYEILRSLKSYSEVLEDKPYLNDV